MDTFGAMEENARVVGRGRDVVVVGASAGGVEPLLTIVAALPANLAAATFVVLHRLPVPMEPSALRDAVGAVASLPVVEPHDGDPPVAGRIYLAPPHAHLVLERGRIGLASSPKEQHARPAVDALFRSAAMAYGRRVVGVVLSGALTDGTVGLWQVKQRGGIAVVQHPGDARHPQMPRSALDEVAVDYCLPAAEIGPLLVQLAAAQPAPSPLSGPAGARLAIVEDERIIARNLQKRLTAFGYQVTASVATGEECLSAMEVARPQVVLMDIRLPGTLDGPETARLLWQRFQVPVIYITAYTDAETLDKVKGTECYGYIVKPFEARAVHAAVQVALDRLDREQAGV